MIKVEAIKPFTLGRFDEIKNIQRKSVEKYGMLYTGDTFECSKELAEYLTGKNDKGNVVVKIIEVIPEEVEVNLNIEYTLDGKTIAKQTKIIKKKGKK